MSGELKLNSVSTDPASMIAKKLDVKDGNSDNKISASIWNDFAAENGGKFIKGDYLSIDSATAIINECVKNVKDLAQKLLSSSDEATPADVQKPAESDIPDDKNGKNTKMEYLPDGTLYEVSEYDDAGNKTKSTNYNSDGSYSIVEYDDKGNSSKNTFYNSDGTEDYTPEYEYDNNGNETKSTKYDSSGEVENYRTFEYDNNGNRTRSTEYDSRGKVVEHIINVYDNSGRETREVIYRSDGTKVIKDFDNNGNTIYVDENTYNNDINDIVNRKK